MFACLARHARAPQDADLKLVVVRFLAALVILATPSTATPDVVAPATNVRLFQLHDPALEQEWADFLATTPMLDQRPLPAALQRRLRRTLQVYQSATSATEPAYFVATYFDKLSDSMFAPRWASELDAARLPPSASGRVTPLATCPVFAGSRHTSAADLLALASGLPAGLFTGVSGSSERFDELFLLTEMSHCRFLAEFAANHLYAERPPCDEQPGESQVLQRCLQFSVNGNGLTVFVSNREELRAVVETVGDVEATTEFRHRRPRTSANDEADILRLVRLISLLTTDATTGYAAIPVMFKAVGAADETVDVRAALATAYRLRRAFRELVPFAVTTPESLREAARRVETALYSPAHSPNWEPGDHKFFEEFVVGVSQIWPQEKAADIAVGSL